MSPLVTSLLELFSSWPASRSALHSSHWGQNFCKREKREDVNDATIIKGKRVANNPDDADKVDNIETDEPS